MSFLWLQKKVGQQIFFSLLSFVAIFGSGIRDKHPGSATLVIWTVFSPPPPPRPSPLDVRYSTRETDRCPHPLLECEQYSQTIPLALLEATFHRCVLLPYKQNALLIHYSLYIFLPISDIMDLEPFFCTDKINAKLSTLLKNENQIFLIYREIQSGAVTKSYITNGLLIYRELFAHFLIF